jgi:hypothetical protein
MLPACVRNGKIYYLEKKQTANEKKKWEEEKKNTTQLCYIVKGMKWKNRKKKIVKLYYKPTCCHFSSQ